MKGKLPLFVVLLAVASFSLAWTNAGWSADSGGYGSPAPVATPAPAPTSGGYGSPAPATVTPPASGGYGSPAPAPAPKATAPVSGGYGSPAPAPAPVSGGYGSPAPAPKAIAPVQKAVAPASGGYGSPAPVAAPTSGGYGSPAPAPATAPAPKTAAPASGGYGSPAPMPAPKAAASTAGKNVKSGPTAPAAAPAVPAAPTSAAVAVPAPVAAPAAPAVMEAAPAPAAPQSPGIPPVNFAFAISALICGGLMGWTLQRGRFCMNTAFRDTIFIGEFVTFRAFLVALIISIIGANLLSDYGVVTLKAQPLWPVAHILGGFVFGMGMVLAGGCGSGIWYRLGEGQIASYVAVIGLFGGIGMTQDGFLKPFFEWTRKYVVLSSDGPILLSRIFGTSMGGKWAFIALVAVGIWFAVRPEKPFAIKKAKGYYWSVAGLLIGLISILALWASAKFGDLNNSARGLSFVTPTRELFFTALTSESHSTIFQNYSLWHMKFTWGVLFIIAVPIGAWMSAYQLKEFVWKTPRDPGDLHQVFIGSIMMGFGSSIALGCNIGHAITGLSTLSLGSFVATLAMILGNWTMVYFKFIKPMKDMDA